MRGGLSIFLQPGVRAPIRAIGPIYEAVVTWSEVITLACGIIVRNSIEREIVLLKLLTNLGGSLTIVSYKETSVRGALTRASTYLPHMSMEGLERGAVNQLEGRDEQWRHCARTAGGGDAPSR
jgi:hypothetical protein